jgi:hypothetical protein
VRANRVKAKKNDYEDQANRVKAKKNDYGDQANRVKAERKTIKECELTGSRLKTQVIELIKDYKKLIK